MIIQESLMQEALADQYASHYTLCLIVLDLEKSDEVRGLAWKKIVEQENNYHALKIISLGGNRDPVIGFPYGEKADAEIIRRSHLGQI